MEVATDDQQPVLEYFRFKIFRSVENPIYLEFSFNTNNGQLSPSRYVFSMEHNPLFDLETQQQHDMNDFINNSPGLSNMVNDIVLSKVFFDLISFLCFSYMTVSLLCPIYFPDKFSGGWSSIITMLVLGKIALFSLSASLMHRERLGIHLKEIALERAKQAAAQNQITNGVSVSAIVVQD